MRDQLNDIIAEAEIHRGLKMPRIGTGHAGCRGGIFSLLESPAGSGPERTDILDILVNAKEDPTAARSKQHILGDLKIPASVITPWNALGAFEDRKYMKTLKENLPLCLDLLRVASPVALLHRVCGLIKWLVSSAFILKGESCVCPIPVDVAETVTPVQVMTSRRRLRSPTGMRQAGSPQLLYRRVNKVDQLQFRFCAA